MLDEAFKLSINIKSTKTLKLIEFADSVDPDKTANDEPSHVYLHCCPLYSEFSVRYCLDKKNWVLKPLLFHCYCFTAQ